MPSVRGAARVVLDAADRASRLLFDEGWRFLLPYLLVYLAAVALGVPVGMLRGVFVLLHAVLALLLLRYAWNGRRAIRLPDALFWLALLAVFVAPGVYLEFPSDAWEHVRRIYKWGTTSALIENRFVDRFPYFLSWSLIADVPPASRRGPLVILSAAYQLLMAYQLHRLARRLGASPLWARVQVLGVLFFFGNLALGFLRYYSLASTSIAYAVYAHALILGLDLAEDRRRPVGELSLALLVIACSHRQELLLLGLSSIGLAAHAVWRRPAWARRAAAALPRVAAAALLAAAGVLTLTDLTYPPPKLLLVPGLPGAVALLVGVVLWPRLGVVSTLAVTPALLICFPPTLLAVSLLLGPRAGDLEWRAFYAFPSSFALVAGARWALERIGATRGRTWQTAAATAMAAGATAVALLPGAPWYGRLWFAFHRPASGLSLEFTDEAAQWLVDNRIATRPAWRERRRLPAEGPFVLVNPPPYGDEPGTCLLITDKATAFGVGAHLGASPPTRRREPPWDATYDLGTFLERLPVCGFLLVRALPGVASEPSRVGALTVHWDPDLVRRDLEGGVGIVDLEPALAARGWSPTPVPPFYVLWEPPWEAAP